MEQKDYLVRQLEMIGPALMYMLGLWKDGRIRDAIEYGAENLEDMSGIPLEELDNIHQDQIVDYLTNTKDCVAGSIRIIAELLFRIGEIRHKEGHPNGRETLLKAKNLYDWYEIDSQTWSFEINNARQSIDNLICGK